MIFMKKIFIFSTVQLLLFCPSSTTDSMNDRTLLGNAFKMARLLLLKCWNGTSHLRYEDVMLSFQGCLKRKSLVALDRISSMKNIQITDGIELVKYKDDNAIYRNIKTENNEKMEWKTQVVAKIRDIFKNHILKVHLNHIKTFTSEGRRRHHHQQMLPLMLFGTMAITMIAIPLGFQFLAVLGGKALLLAKLALILTSIQGLKKIATSNFNYGLYHTPNTNPWHYDRRWYYDTNEEQEYQGYNTQDAPINLLHPLSTRTENEY